MKLYGIKHLLATKNSQAEEITLGDFRALDDDPLVVMQHDPLAAACGSHRKWKQGGSRWSDLREITVTPDDVESAQTIKRYYLDQLLFQQLKGVPLTNFRQELYQLLMGKPVRQSHLGILFRLPMFYEEDVARSQLRDIFSSATVTVQNHLGRTSKKLTPVSYILQSRRGGEIDEYWWKDQTGSPVLWTVSSNNPLKSLVSGLYHGSRDCTLNAAWNVKKNHRQGLEYYVPLMPELG